MVFFVFVYFIVFFDKGVVDELVVKVFLFVKVLKVFFLFKGISGLGVGYLKVIIGKVNKSNIVVILFFVVDFQVVINSFFQDNLIGEGSMGCVYCVEFFNGQVLVVKKIDSSVLMVQNEDDFLSVVDSLVCLQYVNMVEFVGYCIEYD